MTGEASPSASCACGSGLAADRCCQLAGAAPAEPASEREIQAIAAALRGGDMAAGERALIEALTRAPLDLRALRLLQALRADEGKTAAAEALLKRIVRLDPNDLAATPGAGAGAVRQGRAGRGRDPGPQRGADRADRRAVAQSDGHDHDRGASAAGRRASLPPRAGAARPARARSCSPTSPGT